MSTYDQILMNATESEAGRLNRTLKLRAQIGGKYIFAGEEIIQKQKIGKAKKRQNLNQEIKSAQNWGGIWIIHHDFVLRYGDNVFCQCNDYNDELLAFAPFSNDIEIILFLFIKL